MGMKNLLHFSILRHSVFLLKDNGVYVFFFLLMLPDPFYMSACKQIYTYDLHFNYAKLHGTKNRGNLSK